MHTTFIGKITRKEKSSETYKYIWGWY